MNARRLFLSLCLTVFCLAATSPAVGLANRVFVSARSGNDANSCDNVNTPCRTFAGAVTQLNPDGEAIVLDSGGYGPVVITQGVTIEAPAGVTAFIHPPSGFAITIDAGTLATVTLRGLVLNVGNSGGIAVNSVGTLNIENCSITGFDVGIAMLSAGRLNMKGTHVQGCFVGVGIQVSTGLVQASVDHCHLDGNGTGYEAVSVGPVSGGRLTWSGSGQSCLRLGPLGNDANSCDNVNTPCKTFVGALAQLNPDGEAIVLDSGGYGPVTITQGVTIEAPAGVTAFIHPPSSNAITVNAGVGKVTLRGLTLNSGRPNNGITVNSVGSLNVENCFITDFNVGILMLSAGQLNVKGTDIKTSDVGIYLANSSGAVRASIDHCHLDQNSFGFAAKTISPGSSTTNATDTTANNNSSHGWVCGFVTDGKDVFNLEFCTGSGNGIDGVNGNSTNALSAVRYSNCVFANNGQFGVNRSGAEIIQTRVNNTITNNFSAPTSGTITTFSPM